MSNILLLLVLACTAVWAQDGAVQKQSSDTKAQTATVEGTVTNEVTGAPIAGADVVLFRLEASDPNDDSQTLGARTDAAGHFSITGATPGRYRLRAERNQYLAEVLGAKHPGGPGTVLTIAAGQHISNANIALLPSAAIEGRVVDENGDPLVHVDVSAMRYVRRGHRRILLPHGRAVTNDRGEYRIFGLAPGNYYLRATYYPYGWIGAANRPDNLAYLPTYYPGVTDIAEANVVEAQAGAEIPIDFTLTQSATVYVKGNIANPSVQGVEDYNITLFAPGSGPIGSRMERHGTNFEIHGVKPGNYVLEVRTYGQNIAARVGRETITVGTTPLEGVKVVLSSPANIRGALRVDGNARVDFSQLYVTFSEENPADPERMWGQGVQVTARDGTFEISDVTPGDYRLEIGARGRGLEDWYTKSVHFGSRDVTDSLLQVTGGGTMPLDVLISPAGATIQGVVKDANDHPVSAAMVVTVPQGKHADRFDLYQTAATDQQGTFKIRGAAPGTYKVFAWEDVENEAWFDPDFMKNYESQGTSVSVNEWDRSTLSLRVIPSSKK